MNEPNPLRQTPNSPPARLYRLVDRAFAAIRRPEVVAAIDHPAVLARVEAEAGWSHRYAFMVLMSAGIAILGLLLSSPAVIIGAMLVSPLMGPIIGLGFAIAVFDWPEVRKAFVALAAGAALAVAFASAIVFLSPLTDRTPEILARTRPNLFDLLVAVFSALAGGYATVRGRGETIVGVAIATALMPPLAVVGFGFATGDWPIFSGALALFVTNFVAIALSATIMAKFYGFGSHLSPEQSRAQSWALLAVFVALAMPLGFSLRQIAWETLATRTARDAILDAFGGDARIDLLEPRFPDGTLEIRSIVLTPKFQADAAETIRADLAQRLDRPVALRLSQVVTDRDVDRLIRERAADPRTARDADDEVLRDSILLATGGNAGDLLVDPAARRAVIRLRPADGLAIEAARASEERLRRRYPEWDIQLIPPSLPLPPILFPPDSAELSASAGTTADQIAWALTRRGSARAVVTGRTAAGETGGLALADARAEAVAERLRQSGIEAEAGGLARTAEVIRDERERGAAAYRSAVVDAAPPKPGMEG